MTVVLLSACGSPQEPNGKDAGAGAQTMAETTDTSLTTDSTPSEENSSEAEVENEDALPEKFDLDISEMNFLHTVYKKEDYGNFH